MKKHFWVGVLVLAVGCSKCEFLSPEGGFKVKLSGTPKKQKQQVSGIEINTYTVQKGDDTMVVAYSDLPIPLNEPVEKVQDRLDGSRVGMLKNSNAVLVEEDKIQLAGGHPGREIRATLADQKGELRARFWLVGNRLYQVLVTGPPTFTDSTEATTFLQSFELTKK